MARTVLRCACEFLELYLISATLGTYITKHFLIVRATDHSFFVLAVEEVLHALKGDTIRSSNFTQFIGCLDSKKFILDALNKEGTIMDPNEVLEEILQLLKSELEQETKDHHHTTLFFNIIKILKPINPTNELLDSMVGACLKILSHSWTQSLWKDGVMLLQRVQDHGKYKRHVGHCLF